MDISTHKEITLYIENAHESLNVAKLNLENDFYSAAINRAYYAIFYAANAMLATKRLNRNKHSGVLAAFRQHFIKTKILSLELSDTYGRVMEDRHVSDYELITAISIEDARIDIEETQNFLRVVEVWLKKEGWL